MDPKGFIQLSKVSWVILVVSFVTWRRIEFRKITRVLYGLIYKFLGETTKDNLFIYDGKEKGYTTLVSIF